MALNELSILIVCNAGISTGVLVNKMCQIAQNSEKLKDKKINILARPEGELQDYIESYDCVLVGPQITHRFNKIKELCDSYKKPVAIIPSEYYGMVDGAKILKFALKLIVENKK